jgi:hypothetical protein
VRPAHRDGTVRQRRGAAPGRWRSCRPGHGRHLATRTGARVC